MAQKPARKGKVFCARMYARVPVCVSVSDALFELCGQSCLFVQLFLTVLVRAALGAKPIEHVKMSQKRKAVSFGNALLQLLDVVVVDFHYLAAIDTGQMIVMRACVDDFVVGNRVPYQYGLEGRIKRVLRTYHIQVVDFPYFYSPKDSAVGCYLNFLETETCIFLPVFNVAMDEEAVAQAQDIFSKPVVPVCINEIAKQGGVLNCISWEMP